MQVPFNIPFMTGRELHYISQAHHNRHLSGNGPFTKKCHFWLEHKTRCFKSLLTHSCTAALEMAAILAGIKPGDEVIMPSYTFVSTANAFVLRGGVPVFVDIRPDTLNIDECKIEEAITDKTRAIVAVHYAGVACEMDTIVDIARRHNLIVIEDAAQAIFCTYKGQPLGNIGDLATLSFHETKNISCGEGGALLVNREDMSERAEIIWEKGTNRNKFFRGEVDKYSWVDIGSSYLPGEVTAAFLWAQMEEAKTITERRLGIWNAYHEGFAKLEHSGKARRPVVPIEATHNAHMYYLLFPDSRTRRIFIEKIKTLGICAVFHYVPLHSSPMGIKHCRVSGQLKVTEMVGDCLVRLPLWLGLEDFLPEIIQSVIQSVD